MVTKKKKIKIEDPEITLLPEEKESLNEALEEAKVESAIPLAEVLEEPVEEPKLETGEGVKVDYGDETPMPVVEEEPIVEGPEDLVRVKVVFGTVSFNDGEVRTFEKGEVFETSREQASELDQRFIQIL